MPVSQTESTRSWEVENAAILAFAQEDGEGLARKVTLLEGELVEVRQALVRDGAWKMQLVRRVS
jgi:hypothetical protein